MLILIAALLASQNNLPTEDVFVSGRISSESAYDTFRIPALARTRRGTLLAFAEGRRSVGDQSANALVLRRRESRAGEWGPLQVVVAEPPSSLNNPCVLATRSGRIWLMYQRYPAHHNERDVLPGLSRENACLSYVTFSDDDGKSWSKPADISALVKSSDTRSIASGPGIGIELERGKHRGRLVFPFNEGISGQYTDFVVYSDDHGKTWRRGGLTPKEAGFNPNECQVAELSNGDLYLNSRNQASTHLRLTAVSRDGGESWGVARPDPTLTDPVCQGSLLRISFRPDVLAFTNPNDSKVRQNGTLRLSFDGGKSWPVAKLVVPGSFAYSCLCPLPGAKLGLLYEAMETQPDHGESYRIRYTTLEVPKDSG